MSNKINDFLQTAVQYIDTLDVEKEFNDTNIRYSAKFFKDDLEMNSLDCQIESLNENTSAIDANINNKRDSLKKIRASIKNFGQEVY